jgi:glycosyltransferase involved in cell wall biosynthesis
VTILKILYDHQIFYRQNYGGVSRYFCELMNQFSMDPDIPFTLPLRFVQNDNLARFPHLNKYWSGRYNRLYNNNFVSLIQKKIRFNAVNFGLNYIINNQAESVQLLKKQDFDVFHPTYYEPYFLKYLQKKPYVLTVYDMIHELFPEYFKPADKTRSWKKKLIGNAGAVIAISENTKKDIITFTGINPNRVRVIHLGNPFEHSNEPAGIDTSSDPPVFGNPYLLFVGGRSAYKNFNFFIESVAGLLRENEELQAVCAGSSPFTDEEKKFLRDLHILHKVHYIRINEEILKNLYKNARAFVFPSLYEGFGLPILEAFSCGCPVLLTDSSSLPEVGGDAALYFTPGDKESLVRAVNTVLFDGKCRDNLIKKGSERLKLFSWERTAGSTKKVYQDLLNLDD